MSWLIVGIGQFSREVGGEPGAPRPAPGRGGGALYLRALPLSRALASSDQPDEPPLGETPEDVRATLEPLRSDFSVALVAAGNAFAVGAVIRVAHSFLAREVSSSGDGDWYAKASMGMHKYENQGPGALAGDGIDGRRSLRARPLRDGPSGSSRRTTRGAR